MRIAILADPPDLSDYVAEIFKTWGLPLCETIGPGEVTGLDPGADPVVVCPARRAAGHYGEALVGFARRGGSVVTFLPDGALRSGACLESEGEKELPLRMRVTAYPAAGLAGELLPVIGRAETYRPHGAAQVLAYLSHPGRYGGESPGITEIAVGNGRITAFAFDLPLCVLLLRQGDPERSECIPPGDGCARPSHLAAEIGPRDAGWIPFADLLSRLLVDTVRRCISGPVPLLNHLPDAAPGILLYSGDEDHAEVAWNDEEFDAVAAAGGRMNLYIIPNLTHSTAEDGRRYRARHDIGPHPNLRPLDGRPVSERLAEFDRQIRMFQDTFGTPARSVRNHCTAWAGYLEPIEVLERLGVRMDGNYFSGNYMRDREGAPYAAFGGAMPMRFCHPDGRLIDVFHQHTHLLDDGSFSPDAEYSFKLSPGVFPGVLDRAFTDIARRFHTPYGVCIHPSNWVKFSRPQGQELLRQAVEKGFPIWSFDQWCTFWDARDTWRLSRPTWDGSTMDVTVEGRDPHDSLGLILPIAADGARLTRVSLDGEAAAWQQASRYREEIALVSVPTGKTTVAVRTTYGEP